MMVKTNYKNQRIGLEKNNNNNINQISYYTCRPLCVIDFNIVLNALTLIATSSK